MGRYVVVFEDHWAVVDLEPTSGNQRVVARASTADAQMIRDALNGV